MYIHLFKNVCRLLIKCSMCHCYVKAVFQCEMSSSICCFCLKAERKEFLSFRETCLVYLICLTCVDSVTAVNSRGIHELLHCFSHTSYLL